MKARKEWYKYLEDYDKKLYCVIGPFYKDDSDWIDMIQNQIDSGRDLRWQDIEPHQIVDIPEHARQKGLKHVESSLIVNSPPDRSSEYKGSLPQYAKDADRAKLVKILCKGKCGKLQWAELNKPHPGKKALKEAQMGVYKARCMVCGKTAIDNYNWQL
ncbi:MAG: hypothetical protein Q7O12_02270 [Deltaproteobacteria bacterium]|nr:hypothetical protein [Deltaproteobacteria bacterium]